MSADIALQNEIFAARRLHASLTFRTGAPDGIAVIDRVGTVVTLKHDEALFREGDPADRYFKVVRGAVRGCKLLADGRRHIGDFFLPGDFIGLDAAETYGFSAEAVSDITIIRYARRKVEALAWQEPRVAKSLVKMMREDLCAARERMTLLGHLTAMERIASFLLTMADRTGDTRVSLPMTRTDIGDYLGLTMETVSRAFSRLKGDGVIEQKSVHEVVIVDRDALEELAEVA